MKQWPPMTSRGSKSLPSAPGVPADLMLSVAGSVPLREHRHRRAGGTRIAANTGGSISFGVNAATINNTIIAAVTAATNLFNNINLVPAGATAPFVTSIAPAGGYGPVDNTGHDYVFTVTFTAPPCSDTDQVFTGTLDVIGDGHRVAVKKVQLTVLACERWSYGREVPVRVCEGDASRSSSVDP